MQRSTSPGRRHAAITRRWQTHQLHVCQRGPALTVDQVDDQVELAHAASVPASPESPLPGWVYGTIGLLAGIALTCALWAMRPDPAPAPEGVSAAQVDAAIATALADNMGALSAGSQVFDRVAPSLVTVRGTSATTGQGPRLGSGIVLNDEAQVMTALHVVNGSDTIEIEFADGTVTSASIRARVEPLDLVVLAPADLPRRIVPAPMGTSSQVQTGDPIFVIGNPLGLTDSLSSGIISGRDRTIPMPGTQAGQVAGLLQFDAAANEGSSGGPLLNLDGEVVGIVTALAHSDDQGGFIGVGFAIPIDLAISS